MNIVIEQSTSWAERNTRSSGTRFETLWKALQDKQEQHQKIKADAESLLAVYQQQLLPIEQELVEPLALLAERLIDFVRRKSLSNWHREELDVWLHELVSLIDHFNGTRADDLREQYKQSLACLNGITVEELEAQFLATAEPDLQVVMDDFAAVFSDSDSPRSDADTDAEDSPQADMFGFTEVDFEQMVSDLFEEFGAEAPSHAFEQPDLNPPQPEVQPLNGKWIRSLFRRTAQALHPDKEADPAKRDHKHQLMSQLLEARDREDIMTMLTLYSEHVGDGNLTVAEHDAESLCAMLENQIAQMEDELSDFFNEHPFREIAYNRLHSNSVRGRQKRLKESIKGIRQQIEMTDDLRLYLRNLTCLKDVLAQRYEERYSYSYDVGYY